MALPVNYDLLDGVSFAPRLYGEAGTPREWIFDHYLPFPDIPGSQIYRWVQDKTYKLHDTSSTKQGGKFYNIVSDINEIQPIPKASMTDEQKTLRKKFSQVFATMHK